MEILHGANAVVPPVVLILLEGVDRSYEAKVAFTPRQVSLGDAAGQVAFQAVWPESTIIIDWLAGQYAAARTLVPADPEAGGPPDRPSPR
jgi:hypothetical protein